LWCRAAKNRALDIKTDRAKGKSGRILKSVSMRRFSAVLPRFKILQSVCVKDRKQKRKFKHKSRVRMQHIFKI